MTKALVPLVKMLICPVPAEFKNFPVLVEFRTSKFAVREESKDEGSAEELGSTQIGPVTASASTLAEVPFPVDALNSPSPMQQVPPEVPVAVQSSSLMEMLAFQFEFPITVESSVPLKFRHSQWRADAPQPDPLQVPTIGVA